MVATTMEVIISAHSVEWEATCGCGVQSWGSFRKIGSRKASNRFPFAQRKVGTPDQPTTIAPIARIQRGTVIVQGDSWTWCFTSSVPRKSP